MVRSHPVGERFGRVFIVQQNIRRTHCVSQIVAMRRREAYSPMVGIGWPGIMVGAHMCSASLSGTEKSLWEHYNELATKLDATQVTVWHNTADTTLIFVRLSLYILSL